MVGTKIQSGWKLGDPPVQAVESSTHSWQIKSCLVLWNIPYATLRAPQPGLMLLPDTVHMGSLEQL